MDPSILRQFGMEGGGENVPLAQHHCLFLPLGQNLNVISNLSKSWSANEDRWKRTIEALH